MTTDPLHAWIEEECNGFVSRWVLVAEVIMDGEKKELHLISSTGSGYSLAPWDVTGMLAYGQGLAEGDTGEDDE